MARASNRSNRVLVAAAPPEDAEQHRRLELRAFLKARRAALRPQDCGFAESGRRLVPGLRREEVAAAAGVGLTWYTWLEQGRDINVSENALSRVAAGLQLTATDRAYLFWLAGHGTESGVMPAPQLMPELDGVVDGYRWPAGIMTSMFEYVHANPLLRHLYELDRGVGPFHRNQICQTFLSPARRSLLVDYEMQARHFVALFRFVSAAHVGTPPYELLIRTLLARSAFFREVWEDRSAESPAPRSVRLFHRDTGPMVIRVVRLNIPSDEGGLMFFLKPEDEATARALAQLETRLAERDGAA